MHILKKWFTMARPFKDIDWNLVEKLMEADCNGMQIAAKMRLNAETFYRRFKQEYGKSFQNCVGDFQRAGEADLKLSQHLKAINNKAPGNIQMLTFLGKVRLGQREPETLQLMAANQVHIDQSHKIMQLEHEISILKKDDDKSEAE
jgi:AraC-like DNA-binding protein